MVVGEKRHRNRHRTGVTRFRATFCCCCCWIAITCTSPETDDSAGGRIPLISSSLVANECLRYGKLFFKTKPIFSICCPSMFHYQWSLPWGMEWDKAVVPSSTLFEVWWWTLQVRLWYPPDLESTIWHWLPRIRAVRLSVSTAWPGNIYTSFFLCRKSSKPQTGEWVLQIELFSIF